MTDSVPSYCFYCGMQEAWRQNHKDYIQKLRKSVSFEAKYKEMSVCVFVCAIIILY